MKNHVAIKSYIVNIRRAQSLVFLWFVVDLDPSLIDEQSPEQFWIIPLGIVGGLGMTIGSTGSVVRFRLSSLVFVLTM